VPAADGNPNSPATWPINPNDPTSCASPDPYCVDWITKNRADDPDLKGIAYAWTNRLYQTVRNTVGDNNHMMSYGAILPFAVPAGNPSCQGNNSTPFVPLSGVNGNYITRLSFIALHSYPTNIPTEICRLQSFRTSNPDKPLLIEESVPGYTTGDFESFISQSRSAGVSGWILTIGGAHPPAEQIQGLSTDPAPTLGLQIGRLLVLSALQFLQGQAQSYAP
jgi:hypothetical protein